MLSIDELTKVVQAISADVPLSQLHDWPLGAWPASGWWQDRAQAFPGSIVQVIVSDATRADAQMTGDQSAPLALKIVPLKWGVDAPWQPGKLVFNTRIESALRDAARGGGMWGKAAVDNRCIVAAAGFFEPHATERVVSPRTGKPIKRSYLFGAAAGQPLLLGGVALGDCFSIVTTEPNGVVAPVHNRMPLVLMPDEARAWLDGSAFGELADRKRVDLACSPEHANDRLVSDGLAAANAQPGQKGRAGMGQSGPVDQLSLF